MSALIIVTFDARYNHKEEKYGEPQVKKYTGSVLPPRKNFDYWTIYKNSGGAIFIKDYDVFSVETIPIPEDDNV